MNDLPTTRERKNILFDFYGALLTEKQREIYEMHHDEDCSLAEIGIEMGITPQAVADILKRADGKLERYEEKLRLAQKLRAQQKITEKIESALIELGKSADASKQTAAIRAAIDDLLL